MTSKITFVFLTLASALFVACGQDGQKQADNGNADIARLNQISSRLKDEGVYVQTNVGFDTYAVPLSKDGLDKMSQDDLKQARTLLVEYIDRCGDVTRIIGSGEVTGATADDFNRYNTNASNLIKEIDQRLNKKAKNHMQAN